MRTLVAETRKPTFLSCRPQVCPKSWFERLTVACAAELATGWVCGPARWLAAMIKQLQLTRAMILLSCCGAN
ncbi:hypothetical protein LXM25_03035 [Dyadobacter sp. LJ53]|uniref:hypothetical protein n=1 Tax=Dyadobacter chenwenxiniae TaxID=2906456 RepID=UPI001F215EE9|nr:hypothetical protein [Dyadobacter chenwenxiniae]MCF0049016.1 hypothetical protein [Dyadobacter chenwenxiniae]